MSDRRERMADERMTAVVDGEHLEPGGTENPTRRPESLAEGMARERRDGTARD
jgi:hypothetical protein